MAGVVEGRFARWRAGDRAGLLEEWAGGQLIACAAGSELSDSGREGGTGRARWRRLRRLRSDDERRRWRRLLSSSRMESSREPSACSTLWAWPVSLTEAVLRQLQAKHPARARLLPEALPTPPQRVAVQLTDSFRTLRRRAGTGPSGERNEYLRALVGHFDNARADRVMPLFDEFASDVASAGMPSWYYAAQSFATLLPIVTKALTAQGPSPTCGR